MLSPDMLGYLASGFVGISLLMTDMLKLRYINFIGCIMFVIYALIIDALPVAVMNGFCVFINIYYIVKLHNKKSVEQEILEQ